MINFLLEENEKDVFIIKPESDYLKEVMKKENIPLPFDTNWLIYRILKLNPKNLVENLKTEYNASIVFLSAFPFLSFYFKDKGDALHFLTKLNEKIKESPENLY